MRVLAFIIAYVLTSTFAEAASYTAVCRNISGMRVDSDGTKINSESDRVTGAVWVFNWNDADRSVRMDLQHSGGARLTQSGAHVATIEGAVTFVSVLSGAVWTYTIYPNGRDNLLVTQHTTTNTGAALAGKLMTGVCTPR